MDSKTEKLLIFKTNWLEKDDRQSIINKVFINQRL